MNSFEGRTLFDLVEARAVGESSRLLYSWWDGTNDSLSYEDLARLAHATSVYVSSFAQAGEPVLLLLPPGRGFVAALFGCIFAKVLAVPLPPTRGRRGLERIRAVARDCGARSALVLCGSEKDSKVGALGIQLHPLNDASLRASDSAPRATPNMGPDDPVLLQYTSGSTRTPKGVTITHRNLLSNCEIIRSTFGHRRDDRGLIWLPPHHDMGLVGGIFQPLYAAMTVALMPAITVTQRPRAWLEAITAFGATVSGGPDSMYRACVQRHEPEGTPQLDLSSWRVAFCGAEPVRRTTMCDFAETFAPFGFDSRALLPCYGLAESTLLVSGGPRGRGAVTAADSTHPARVASGAPSPHHEVLIVDPASRVPMSDGQGGEIWVQGPSVAPGYHADRAGTRYRFFAELADGRGPFLRTGDLGHLWDGQLFVTGRLDELIVLRGQNLYPADIEEAVRTSQADIRSAVACGVEREDQTELLIVVECTSREPQVLATIEQLSRQAVVAEYGIAPHHLVLVRAGTLPRTTSGKVQRFEVRRQFEQDELHRLRPATLRAPDVAAADALRDAPQGEFLERLLTWISARTASVAPDPDRPLVASGLDSVDLAALLAAWPVALGAPPSLTELLEPTASPRRLAHGDWPTTNRSGLSPRDAERRHVITGARAAAITDVRRALWTFDRARGGHPGLVLSRSFRLRGPVDVLGVKEALQTLLRRHPSLTQFWPSADRAADAPDDLQMIWVGENTHGEALSTFDITREPPFRAVIRAEADGAVILSVRAHHLAVDLGALSLLLRELLDTLTNTPLADPVQVTLEPMVDPSRVDRARDYFERTLAKPTAVLPAAPHAHHGPVARYFLRLDRAQALRLESAARDANATPFIVAASVWSVLARRLFGPSAGTIGCPVSLRPPGLDAVGYFVNILPLCIEGGHADRWSQVFADSAARWREAVEHREVAFARALPQPVGGRGAQTLPPTLVVFDRWPGDPDEAELALGIPGARLTRGALSIEGLQAPLPGAQVPVALSLLRTREGFIGALDVDTRRVGGELARTLPQRYAQLLEAATTAPQLRVTATKLLVGGEEGLLTGPWACGPQVPPEHTTIGTWWREVVLTHRDRVAIRWPQGVVTYGELNEAALALAAHLVQQGLKPEEPIAFLADRRPESLVAMLGILEAGGVFLALDPTHPPTRHQGLLGRLGVRRVVVAADAHLDLEGLEIIRLPITREPTAPLAPVGPTSTADSAAYVIFTSGSSGHAKPVLCTHGGLCQLVRAQQAAFGAHPGARTLQFASFAFDASISEVFVTLLTAGELLLRTGEGRWLGDALEADLANVDIVTLPPAVLARLDPERFPRLRTVISAGELCPDEVVRRWSGGRRFINAYGPTESTVCATLAVCDADMSGAIIGRPIASSRTYVLDESFTPVPPGAAGELFLAGPSLARGYPDEPALTAERFLPDPYGPPGSRMYRTGDRAQWGPDRNLAFLGRLDRMVKVRGVRIELAEVERHLTSFPGVGECVVGVCPIGDEARLVAWWTPTHQGADLLDHDLREQLRRELPEAMVPSVWVRMIPLPRGVNGKVDPSQLKIPRASTVPPPTIGTLEAKIAAVWCATIPADAVGPDDRFFDVGGTSLTAVDVHTRLQDALDRRFALETLYTYPTVRALARHLEGGSDDCLPVEQIRASADRGRAGLARLQRARKRGSR